LQHAAILLQLHQSAGKHLVRNQSPLTAEKKNHGRTPRGKRERVIVHGAVARRSCARPSAIMRSVASLASMVRVTAAL